MIAPRTTTPATISTFLSSLSEWSGWVSPDWICVSVTRQRYWLRPTTTQSFSRWPASPASRVGTYAVEVLDARQARAAPACGRPRPTDSTSRITRRVLRQVSRARSSLRPAALGERREEGGVGGDVLEPVGQHLDPVVVAAEADVVDAGHLAHVLAVGHHVGQRRGRRRVVASTQARSKAAKRGPSDSGTPSAAAAATISRCASAQAAFTNFGTKVTMHTPPPRAIDSSTSSGALRGLSVTARAELWLKITGASLDLERVAHRVGATRGTGRPSSPSRFISRTTSRPKAVSPPATGRSVAESAHGVFALWVRVR